MKKLFLALILGLGLTGCVAEVRDPYNTYPPYGYYYIGHARPGYVYHDGIWHWRGYHDHGGHFHEHHEFHGYHGGHR